MEIRVQAPGAEPQALAVTMRTPGNDFELAVGFCVSEGILRDRAIARRRSRTASTRAAEQQYNVVTLRVRHPDRSRRATLVRRERELWALRQDSRSTTSRSRAHPSAPVRASGARCSRRCPIRLREAQRLFDETGGLHAAATLLARR